MEVPSFQFFDHQKALRVTHRNLPHWEQEEVCAFVTMRLGDSLPLDVKAKVDELRNHWIRSKGLPENTAPGVLFGYLTEPERRRFHRLASKTYQHALDQGSGSCLFKKLRMREHVMDVLLSGQNEGYRLGEFVIMPNHLHLLIQPLKGKSLKTELSAIRRISARRINRELDRSGNLWQPEPFDHLVRSEGQFRKFQKYIECNPRSAGLRADEYSHGSVSVR